MPDFYVPYQKFTSWLLLTLLVWLRTTPVHAQTPPAVTAVNPRPNALNVPANTIVSYTFSQPMSNLPAQKQTLRLFSQQQGGVLTDQSGGNLTINNNTYRFTPSGNFKPGETIFATLTSQAKSSSEIPLAKAQVRQFTVGTGGTGVGNFKPHPVNPELASDNRTLTVALGDIDKDGDLDIVTASFETNFASVRLNDGNAIFSDHPVTPRVNVGAPSSGATLADIDNDSDLDLLVTLQSNKIAVLLNDGAGNFSLTTQQLTSGYSPQKPVLGDIDGDGDLDLLTANVFNNGNSVSVWLNDNNTPGTFIAQPPVPVQDAYNIALGDIDGDGDLDLLIANVHVNGDKVSVWVNTGSGSFIPHPTTPVLNTVDFPVDVVPGDLDGDGDLDFATVSVAFGDLQTWFNDGLGNFTTPPTNPNVTLEYSAQAVVLGDVDGDGDLDLLTPNAQANKVNVAVNNGSGRFSAHPLSFTTAVGELVTQVALGDIDDDGDLDIVTSNRGSLTGGSTVSIRLNQPADLISGFTAIPGTACVGTPVTFTASVNNLTGTYSYTLTNGTDSGTVSGTAGTATFSQPLTASGSGLQTFTLIISNQGYTSTAVTTMQTSTAAGSLVSPFEASGQPGPGNCQVLLSATGSGNAFVMTGPGGYVFSAVYRNPGIHQVTGQGVRLPGIYTLTVYNGSCVTAYTTRVSGTACP